MDNSPLGALPKEIRDRITELALVYERTVNFMAHGPDDTTMRFFPQRLRRNSPTVHQLLSRWPSTCRQARTESNTVFFLVNEFYFHHFNDNFFHFYDKSDPLNDPTLAKSGFTPIYDTFQLLGSLNIANIPCINIDIGYWPGEMFEPHTLLGLRRDIEGLRDCLHPEVTLRIVMELSIHYFSAHRVSVKRPFDRERMRTWKVEVSVTMGDSQKACDKIDRDIPRAIAGINKLQTDLRRIRIAPNTLEKCAKFFKSFVYAVDGRN